MALFDTTDPEQGSISIRFPNFVSAYGAPGGAQFRKFLSYEYNSDFLTPADQWSFTISGDSLSSDMRAVIQPGQLVELTIDGQKQSVGYVDDVKTTCSSRGGTIIRVEGRDWMAPAVDCHVSQDFKFASTATLLDLLNQVFAPFGMNVVSDDNAANNNAITGATRGHRTSKKGKTSKSALQHETKPYPQEGAFAFASRVSQRFGLWLWPSVTLGTIICGQPDFLQDPSYQLLHSTDPSMASHNNVEDSDVVFSRKDQPGLIFASGFGGGGNFAKSKLRGGIINPLVQGPEALFGAIFTAFPDVKFAHVDFDFHPVGGFIPIVEPNARPLYLYDPESHTQDQLDAYLRREMSLKLRKALTANYTIMGHKLAGQPIAVDTMVSVKDDRSALDLDMWILGRKFTKSHDGTRTQIQTILPGALTF